MGYWFKWSWIFSVVFLFGCSENTETFYLNSQENPPNVNGPSNEVPPTNEVPPNTQPEIRAGYCINSPFYQTKTVLGSKWIRTQKDLEGMQSGYLYALSKDIELDSSYVSPTYLKDIIFDGRGKSIRGLRGQTGLFNELKDSAILDLSMEAFHVSAGDKAMGLLAYHFSGGGCLEKIKVRTSKLYGNQRLGGLIAGVLATSGFIGKRLDVEVEIYRPADYVPGAANNVGGLFAWVAGSGKSDAVTRIVESRSSGVISLRNLTQCVGGLVGATFGGASISRATSSMSLSAFTAVGGLVGCAGGEPIEDSYFAGEIIRTDSSGKIGHLVGWNTFFIVGSITNCFSSSRTKAPFFGNQGNSKTSYFVSKEEYDTETVNHVSEDDLKNRSTFVGWDFSSVWKLDPGSVPKLRWE